MTETPTHAATWQSLTTAERALLLGARARGGVILDNPDWAPDCGTLVQRGLVGKHEAALTQAGHELAGWADAALTRVAELEAEPDLAAAEQIADRALRYKAEYPEDRAVVVVAALARAGMLRRAFDAVPAAETTPDLPARAAALQHRVDTADDEATARVAADELHALMDEADTTSGEA